MATYITIDGGTTNTRIRIVKDKEVQSEVLLHIGAGGGSEKLKEAVKGGLLKLSEKAPEDYSNAECIIASGMVTSELGIYPLEHRVAPAGIREMHSSMEKAEIKEISQKPFYFIRGVKTEGKDFEKIDMMRGEETELIGLCEKIKESCIYILPGSHSKIIETDGEGRIADFSTMLTGEMIAALSQNTILKNSLDLENAELCEEYLISGYEYCKENGINKSLFKVRVIKNMLSLGNDEAYSFFMGAVLFGEIREIVKKNPKEIVVGGKAQIKNAMNVLLSRNLDCPVSVVGDERASVASAVGMVKIYEFNG